ncbi:MAG: AAA family ATPase [Microcoleus vaginatus WJT46-NPBG5]|jgi:predicted ATPase/class 3 adenylate cyclase/GAF domain-containing protein/tRNA A-37 threonylcarbamoyl transferase component Bud32|nr:AAA family ATPase [Microcoleus vaginatus WJT46-NPBG5]
MITVAGISVKAQIYESANSLVYGGIRESDHQPVILKVLKQDYPTPAELTRYRTEYQITKCLNLAGVVQVYDLQKYQNTLVMFLEDFGGKSLKYWMQQSRFTLEEFLQIAIATTDALGQIHAANVIHKDINPSNLVFNKETHQLKIIDFGISTKLTRETPALKNPNVLEGTLAYMSPEQTGRMNRVLDYRTDFYSLGVTFYELLTNQLPFETDDALELVHCHIARVPVSPSQLNPEIPNVVSAIVMKLMAKTAEERYQSVYGILADLKECLNQLQCNGKISDFWVAGQDISEKFQISQKLYGREREVETLLTAFEQVCLGQTEMMLVAGYSGIGKSALVQELYKPITQKRGYFISGKFDQYQRNIPYSAIVSAFRELVKQLLTENTQSLQEWREKLLDALGINTQVIVEVIPEVELITGKQPTVPELGPTESLNRFNLVFQNFIKVFTQPSHPLAIFLDDLQWADGASLKLMQLLMSAASTGLFLIGAYRDNEVSSAHPLTLTLDEIAKKGVVINRIFLSPLELPTVTQLISDTLNCKAEIAKPLAELLLFKTDGNPFFLSEFLKSLYTDNLLTFEQPKSSFESLNKLMDRGSWQWNLAEILARDFTDNVVELMASKIQRLPNNTQEMLKLAACIGNQFESKTLTICSEKALQEVVSNLDAAVAENLVVILGTPSDFGFSEDVLSLNLQSLKYKFVHDRIQQAAYSLIPEAEKLIIHRQIGRLLLQNTFLDKREEKIFDIVNQLNFGIELITERKEKDELAQLNLIAGKKAKASTAYEAAFSYLQTGIELLGKEGWRRQYQLVLELSVEAAETAYLNGDFEQMDKIVEVVVQKAKTVLDQVKVVEVKITAFTAKSQLEEAIDIGLKFLRQVGVKLPKNPNTLNILMGLMEIKLAMVGKRILDLVDLPEMTDPYKLAAMRILSRIFSPAYFAAPKLLPLIVFQQVILSIKHGNSPKCLDAYSSYGLILCGVVQDIESGYEFGQLSLRLLDKFSLREFKSKTLHIVSSFISHWKAPVAAQLLPLVEAYKSGLETGDFEYATYAAFVYCCYSYMIGKDLPALELQIAAYSQAMKQLKQQQALSLLKSYHQAVLNLLSQVENPCNLTGDACNEESVIPLLIEAKDRTSLFALYLNKLILCYLFEQYPEALSNATFTEQYLDSATATLCIGYFYFYDSLTRLAVYPTVAKTEQKQFLEKVKSNQNKIKTWAKLAPMNYLNNFYLVEAELCRVLGKNSLALDYYDRAIYLAKEHEYIHEAAFAYELVAKYYLSQGKDLNAKAYMQEARYCYQLWGATAKVKDLETRYRQLLVTAKGGIQDTKISTSLTSSGSSSSLDIASVMKASQAISGEIVLDKLLSSLMKILIENAGAQKGYLILESQGRLLIEAVSEASHNNGRETVNCEQITVLQSIPIETSQNLAATIINYVSRTKETIVLNDASCEEKFSNDPYIKEYKPKSILCVPLINQGKIVSIVYLENNLTTGTFTPERVEVLKLLSSSAAISIQNAKLYSELSEVNHDLEKALENELELAEAASRFVPNQFLSFLGYESLTEIKLGDAVQLEMSILFSDIRDFTTLSESLNPADNFKFINSYLSRMEPAILENHGFIDKYIGDAIMALFSGEADNAVKAGISMLHRLAEYNQHRTNSGYHPIQIGIGINTGTLMLGTVGGQNRMDGTVISDAVNLASRVEGLTKNYGLPLLITQQTYERLTKPADYAIRTIDTVKVKGKSQAVTVYEIFETDPPALKNGKLNTLQSFTEALSLYNLEQFNKAAQLFEACLRLNPGDQVAQIYRQRCYQNHR